MSYRINYRFVALLCGVVAAAIGIIGIMGWGVDRHFLAVLYKGHIPLSPNSALSFLLLGSALAIRNYGVSSRFVDIFSRCAALVVLVVSSLTIAQFIFSTDFGIDRLFVNATELFGPFHMGRMSPIGAVHFFLLSAALLLLEKNDYFAQPAIILATAVLLTGSVMGIGYAYGAPLFYGGPIRPVSLVAAVGYIVLGIGFIADAGPHYWPLRQFTGPSIKARLMRTFLPFIVVTILVNDWVHHFAFPPSSRNPALDAVSDSILSAFVLSILVAKIAKFISKAIDRAEADRRQAEEALRDAETRFRTICEQSIVGTSIIQDGKFRYVNPRFAEMFGYSQDEILSSKTILDFIIEEDRALVAEQVRRRMQGEAKSVHYTFRGLRKEGTVIDVEVFGSSAEINGKIALVSVLLDITVRQRVEDDLQLFKSLIDQSNDAFFAVDPETGGVIDFNKKACASLGYGPEELMKMRVMDIEAMIPDLRSWKTHVAEVKEKRYVIFEGIHRRKNGSTFPVEVNMKYITREQREYFVGIARDITERKESERSLLESHERFLAVLEGLDALVYAADMETHEILFLNKYGIDTFGNAVGRVCWQSLQTGQTKPCEFCSNDKLLTPGGEPAGVYAWEFRNTVDNRWYAIRDKAIRWVDGRIARLEIAMDITEQKLAEKALKKERDRARRYLNVAGVIIIAIDTEQKVSLINRKGCEILGVIEDEVVGKPFIDCFIPKRIRGEIKEIFRKILSGETEQFAFNENSIVTKSGEERIISWHNTLLRDEQGRVQAVLSSGEDVTERKKLEDQLHQAQKMQAVGQLAGGVAHDFNNLLTAIMGYTYMLQLKIGEDSPLLNYTKEILNAATSASGVTQGLLAFSRKQIIHPKPLNVNQSIRKTIKLLSSLINEDIELRVVLADGDLMVMADSVQIEQVLINLITNARDAMPNGGKLEVAAQMTSMDDVFIGKHGYGTVGQYALISISDTGIGMDQKTRERIFEPFFTTKEIGKGTGMGLSIVFGIVKQHNGYINVYSEPGEGTTFKLYLPLLTTGMMEQIPATASLPAGGTETILLAEDNTAVRAAAVDTLSGFGYTLIEAVDGEDAIGKFKEHGSAIQLLLLDVVMPKRNGKEVYEVIRTIRPDIKVLFTSGYTADIIHRKGILEEELNFISKPVNPQELLKAVRKALDN